MDEEFKLTTQPESLKHGELGLFLKAVPVLLKHLEDMKTLKAAIRDSGIPERNVRWGVALRRLEERFRGE